jgi:hypothetical protein
MHDFFRCAARLLVTIYDLLLASILGVRGRLVSVAYPFTYKEGEGLGRGRDEAGFNGGEWRYRGKVFSPPTARSTARIRG